MKKKSDDLEDSTIEDDLKSTSFSRSEIDELLSLRHCALRIRGDIKSSPGIKNCTSVSKVNADKIIPESLFLFLSILLSEESDEQGDDKYVKRTALSISQDLVYAISKRKKLTPKHVGLGLALHQATRSKSLVELVHHAGHCVSYDQVRRIDTALGVQNLKHFETNNNTPIPSNILPNTFCQYAADNIDIIEETLDGMGTFHATQMVVYQRGTIQHHHQDEELPVGKSKSLKIYSDLHQLEKVIRHPYHEEPKFTEKLSMNMFTPDERMSDEAAAQDMAWILCRIHGSHSECIPAWTGFNQLTIQDEHELCTVGYLPLLNSPAHEIDTLWTNG